MLKINKSGTRLWRNTKGQYHRINAPAIEWNDGNKSMENNILSLKK